MTDSQKDKLIFISITRSKKNTYAVMLGGRFFTKGGRVVLFESAKEAASRSGAKINGTQDIGREDIYDLDLLEKRISDGDAFADNEFLLKYWDFFDLFAHSVGSTFAGGGRSFVINDIYEKLYTTVYGGSDDERFFIDDEEERIIEGVIGEGIRIFEKNTALF